MSDTNLTATDPARFGRFEIRLAQRQLLIDGAPVALGSRAFDVLAVLVERRDRLVSKSELIELVWPGLVVEENNLQVQVSMLRKLLGAQVIATIPGRGYRFTAAATAQDSPPAPPAAPARAALPAAPAAGPPQLLVADDNKVNRLLLCRALELMGHRVAGVEDGAQALALLRRERFELLLLDLEMPGLDGFAVLEQLAADADLRDLPVIVTSSVEGVASVARCIALGADDYLSKPVNPVLLKARVTSSLEKKRLRDQQKALIERLAAGAAPVDAGPPATGAARVQASVLQARLHGLAALAQAAPPEDTLEALDSWHTLMFDAVLAHGGVVNLVGGDTLVALFGAPLALPDPADAARAAVRAALEMAEMVELFNAERAARSRPPVALGIGIASGELVAGYTGAPRRTAYTCAGATLERAAQIAVLTADRAHPIVVDAPTHAALAGRLVTEALPAGLAPGGLHAVRAG
ncbi:response regulator [Aquincola sp. S2]|uniref:Response regulator n=1 Tax=Pseudaquabacterium terrae TaxID=2732868 RepID=A0ABX2EK72_9BURK|nr:response regulator [Aquabacterium terrae]NRF68980.1 response regulator [Aquabacterium terrae]